MPETCGQALLIANANYSDKTLSVLRGTEVDVRALEAVLTDPIIGGYQVQTSLDEPIHRLRQRIERFFVQAPKGSLLLLYLSGHGIKDRDGRLYFAGADTDSSLLISTGLAAAFIQEASERSRCRRQVFIFDACFSGAFARGYFHKSDQKVHAQESFSGGTGKIIITASDDIQYALVGDEIEGSAAASVFTRHLVEGLRTGAPPNDAEVITADRLYQYVYERVLEDNPAQKPQLWGFGLNGDLILARNPAPKPIKLPAELVELLEDPRPKVRVLGIDETKKLLVEPTLHQAINSALEKLRDDDSKIVYTRAAQVQAEVEELLKKAEQKRQAEAEAKRRAEEEQKRQAEAEAKRRAEEEQKRQAEAEAKRRAEEEQKRQAEAEAKRRAEEEQKRQAEAEAKRGKRMEAKPTKRKTMAIAMLVAVVALPLLYQGYSILRETMPREREAEEAKEKQDRAEAALRAVDAALAQDDAAPVLARLEEARQAGVDEAVLAERRRRLRDRVETLAALAAQDVKKALQAQDSTAARAAIKRARELKAQAEAVGAQAP